MAKSTASTVNDYLASLPEERRKVISGVLEVVRANLPAGYREAMSFGMISWCVPLERYPKTYNGQPLAFAALAAQKNHYALYLMDAYQSGDRAERLKSAFAREGKKLDMGKSCIRFRKLEDLALDGIGEWIAAVPVDEFIARYEAARATR